MKTLLVDAVHTFVIKGQGIFQEMYDLLKTYPNPKIVLTNADDTQIEKHNLTDLPYELFTLKHNPDKSDPIYYEKLLKHYGLLPSDVVCFEHSRKAVDSARSVGIKTYYYDAIKRDLTGLSDFLDKSL